MEGLKPMWEQRQDVWMEAQSAEAHPGVPRPHCRWALGREKSPQRARSLRQVKTEGTKFSYTFQCLQDHTLSTHSSQLEGLHTFCAPHAASVAASHTHWLKLALTSNTSSLPFC